MNKKYPVSLLLISYLFISVNASFDGVDEPSSIATSDGQSDQTVQETTETQPEAVTTNENQQPNLVGTGSTAGSRYTHVQTYPRTSTADTAVPAVQAGQQVENEATAAHSVQQVADAATPVLTPSAPAKPAARSNTLRTNQAEQKPAEPENKAAVHEPAKLAVEHEPKVGAANVQENLPKVQQQPEVLVVQPATNAVVDVLDVDEDDEDEDDEDEDEDDEAQEQLFEVLQGEQPIQHHPEHVQVQEAAVVKAPEAKKCGGKDCKDGSCEHEENESNVCSCGMPGYFIFDYKTTILMKQIKTTRAFEYYVALVSMFAISLFPFMLKSLRVILVKMINRTPSKFNYTLTMLVSLFFSLAIVTIDYGLMLVAMSFNVGYFFAIVGGLSLSYSIFGQILESPCHCKSSAMPTDCCC